jgi:DNA-binding NarL/FixJ family response regulator
MGAAIRPERDQAMMDKSPSPHLPFSPSQITIVIADDHPIFRRGLRQAIETDPHLKVVSEAGDGEATIAYLEALKPQVAVLDIDMPGKDGFAIADHVREHKLSVAIIFLTMHADEQIFNTALDAGVKGYVLKDDVVTDIIKAIRAVAVGENYISPELATFLVRRANRAGALAKEKPSLATLTSTEQRVLKLISEYKTSREIADEMHISFRTVERHRANICEKLDLKGSHALLKFATEHRSQL